MPVHVLKPLLHMESLVRKAHIQCVQYMYRTVLALVSLNVPSIVLEELQSAQVKLSQPRFIGYIKRRGVGFGGRPVVQEAEV